MVPTTESPSFWFDKCFNFFDSFRVPFDEQPFESKMNELTKLILLVFIVIALTCSVRAAGIFLGVGIFFIIVFYYCGKRFIPSKECYGNVASLQEAVPPVIFTSPSNNLVITPSFNEQRQCFPKPVSVDGLNIKPNASNLQLINGQQSSAYQYEGVPLEENISLNQKLAGKMTPKTLVQPVIPSPIFDFDTWQPTDFVVPTGINEQKTQEMYYNGYTVDSTTEPSAPPKNLIPLYKESLGPNEAYPGEAVTKEQFLFQNNDYVNIGCGYHPDNLSKNLPVNYNASPQLQDDPPYNANLFSIPLQPDVYTTSQVNQNDASMSNLGISYTQQFEPTVLEPKGNFQEFVELDPLQNKISTKQCNYNFADEPHRRNIFDPRNTGYGTQYRSYVDPVVGQPRFYYRDIDQQNNNGYLTKNNVDFASFGTSTGVYPHDDPLEGQALYTFADETYTNSMIGQRTELQQRLMHKNSNRAWQQRVAPIRTNVLQQRPGTSTASLRSSYAGPRGG